MFLKVERQLARLGAILRSYLKLTRQVYVQDRIAEYRALWKAAAEAEGANFNELAEDVWDIEKDGRHTRIKNDILEFDNPVTLEIAGRKPLIYKMLQTSGLQVPPHRVYRYDRLQEAESFLAQFPAGCVIKPANGTSSGQGVTTHITSARQIRKASILASLYCKELLIEPMIAGECYRLLVFDGRVVHAVCRRGYRLTGDGVSTVAALMQRESPPLSMDSDSRFNLLFQHLAPDSVPEKGRTFLIKSVNEPSRKFVEVRTIYNTDVTGRVCGAMIDNAVAVAGIIRSRFVGVDFITPDETQPLEKTGGVINEVNTTPGLHHHYDMSAEKYPAVAGEILRVLLSPSVH